MSDITIEEFSAQTVTDVARVLQSASAPPLIDLRPLANSIDKASKGPAPLWALALGNIFLRVQPQVGLRVRFPSLRDARVRRFLDRSGMLFALAQRDDVPENCWEGLRAERASWRTDWRRSGTEQRHRLFDPQDAAPDTDERWELASFVNPHREGAAGLDMELGHWTVRPWVFSRLQRRSRRVTEPEEQLANEVGWATFELVQNIPDWADLRRDDHSLVQVHLTSGEKKRVYVTAFDTGQGIVASLRGRQPQLFAEDGTAWSPEEALNAILRRDPSVEHGRGRGKGLKRVLELTRRYQGELQILTGPVTGERTNAPELLHVARTWRDGPSADTGVTRHTGIPLRGTLIRASFHLTTEDSLGPRRQRGMPLAVSAP